MPMEFTNWRGHFCLHVDHMISICVMDTAVDHMSGVCVHTFPS